MVLSIVFMYICVLALLPLIGLSVWLLSERERDERRAANAASRAVDPERLHVTEEAERTEVADHLVARSA